MRTGIRAIDIMTSKVISAHPDMALIEAGKLMNKYRIGGLPVVKNDKLVGIITERNIMRSVIARDKKPGKVKIKDIMIKKSKLITGDKFDDIDLVAKKMTKHDITRIPVLDNGRLVGIITNRDVIKHSNEYLSVLLEQARIKGPADSRMPLAHGKCDRCGAKGHLIAKENELLCEFCL